MPVESMSPPRVGDVHRPALAAAGPVLASEHLAEDLDQGNALGDLVVQPPVGGDQTVVPAQTRRKARGDRLLAARGPIHGQELPGGDALAEPFVAGLDQGHDLEHLFCFSGHALRSVLTC